MDVKHRDKYDLKKKIADRKGFTKFSTFAKLMQVCLISCLAESGISIALLAGNVNNVLDLSF